jgi:hypothetical protein
MNFAETILLSVAGGVIAALAPLIYLFYYTRPVTFTVWTGAVVTFIGGFIFTLLALQWGLFYVRYTYILALALLLVSIAYAYWGVFRRRWFAYLFAAVAWIYIILLAVVARALGFSDPFII